MNEKKVKIWLDGVGTAEVFESTLPVWTHIGWVVVDEKAEQPSSPEAAPEVVPEPDTPIFNEVSDSTGVTESVQEPVSGPDSV